MKKFEPSSVGVPVTEDQPLLFPSCELDSRTKLVREFFQNTRTSEPLRVTLIRADGTPAEISDVPLVGSVAVALTNPLGNVPGKLRVKLALPAPSVVTFVKPR